MTTMGEEETILKNAKGALEQNRHQEALAILDKLASENNGEAIFLKGEIYFKLQQWGDALNQFSRYLDQFPSDTKAESYCVLIQNILGFYHKDLYNP
jgi:tetratricopeptide (TPR) repeat protein